MYVFNYLNRSSKIYFATTISPNSNEKSNSAAKLGINYITTLRIVIA